MKRLLLSLQYDQKDDVRNLIEINLQGRLKLIKEDNIEIKQRTEEKRRTLSILSSIFVTRHNGTSKLGYFYKHWVGIGGLSGLRPENTK